MGLFKNNIIFDVLWINLDGVPQVFRPHKKSAGNSWKIPIPGRKGVYEVRAGEEDRRIIQEGDYWELPIRKDGRMIVICDKFSFLREKQTKFNEIKEELKKAKNKISELKEKLNVEQGKTIDTDIISQLEKEKVKIKQKQDIDGMFENNTNNNRRRF